MSLEMDIA